MVTVRHVKGGALYTSTTTPMPPGTGSSIVKSRRQWRALSPPLEMGKTIAPSYGYAAVRPLFSWDKSSRRHHRASLPSQWQQPIEATPISIAANVRPI